MNLTSRSTSLCYYQWRSQDFGSGGNPLGGQPRGGSEGRRPSPGRRRIFENFQNFFMKSAKNALF